MGCRHSVAAAAAAPVSAEAKTLVTPADNDAADVERTSRLPVESSHNNNKASTKASLHPQQSGWEDFTSLYRVMKQVTGGAAKSGLSNIYLVVKHGSDEEPPATAATDEATTDESQKEDGTDRPHYEDDNLYIMQVIDIKSVAPERRKAMKKEIQSLKLIQHPNILRVCDVFDATKKDNTIATVTEMCTGQHLHASTPYPEIRVRAIVMQILDALAYMHQRGLFLNNLTTENILFQDDSQDAKIKITYAGVSSSLSSNNSFAAVPLTSEWGQHGKDVYSVGMIAYKLFSGGKEPPTDMDTQLVAHGTNLFLGRRWKLISISRNAKQFIEKCLQSDSTRQHTLEQAMVHPWITQERSHRSIVAVSLAATNAPSLLSSPTVSSFSQQQSKSREEKKVESCSDPVDGGIVDNSDVARTLAVVSLSTKQYNLDVKSKQDEDVDNGDVARTGVAVSLSTEQYILDLKSKRDDMEGDVVDSTILEYPADTNVISDNNVANEGNHFSEVDQSVPVPLVLIPTSTGPLERHETLQPAPESEACDDQTDQETIVQNVPGAESILMNFSIGEPLVYTDNPSNDPSDSSQIVDEVDAAKATKEEHEKNHDKGDETPHFLAGDTVDSDDDSFGPIPSNDLEPVTNDVSTMDSDGLDEVEPADEDVGDGNKEEPPTEQANPPGDETQSSANDAIQPNKSDELETTVIQSSDREVQDDDVGADAMSFAGSTEKADADVEIDATLFTNDGAETEAWMGDSTPAEFHDLRDMLAEAETEKGGDYTVEELKAKLTTKYTEEEVDSWFQGGRFDDTRNLKYTEFLSTVIKSRRTIEIRRIKEAFLAIDKGKRGFVTVGNLRAVLGSNNSENTEMLIKAADSKRDGRISFENFEDVVKQWAGEDHADD